MTLQQKITFGEMRASGVRGVLVYCRDHQCDHSIEMELTAGPTMSGLSDIETKLHLHRLRQAPKFSRTSMGTG